MKLLDRLDALHREASKKKVEGSVWDAYEHTLKGEALAASLRNAWPLISRLVRAQEAALTWLCVSGAVARTPWPLTPFPGLYNEYKAALKAVEEAGA